MICHLRDKSVATVKSITDRTGANLDVHFPHQIAPTLQFSSQIQEPLELEEIPCCCIKCRANVIAERCSFAKL